MRTSETFENIAMDIYQLFDDVINNLEAVDKALVEIRTASISFPLNKPMIKVNVVNASFVSMKSTYRINCKVLFLGMFLLYLFITAILVAALSSF